MQEEEIFDLRTEGLRQVVFENVSNKKHKPITKKEKRVFASKAQRVSNTTTNQKFYECKESDNRFLMIKAHVASHGSQSKD